MHDAESRALVRAATLLLAVSVLRWGWSVLQPAPPRAESSVLPELLAGSREAADENDRRTRPLGEDEQVDPNRADEVTLDRLPGVGPATAQAILDTRADGVVFRTPEDLLAVRGIGPATLERIRPHLSIADVLPPRAGGRRVRAPVDVNRADAEGLRSLPGVGPAIADRIVAERREQMFESVEDLERVRGIGPATVERLRPLVVVGHGP